MFPSVFVGIKRPILSVLMGHSEADWGLVPSDRCLLAGEGRSSPPEVYLPPLHVGFAEQHSLLARPPPFGFRIPPLHNIPLRGLPKSLVLPLEVP